MSQQLQQQPVPEMSQVEWNRYQVYLFIMADKPLLEIEVEAARLGLSEAELEQVFDIAVCETWKPNQRPYPTKQRQSKGQSKARKAVA